MFAIIDIETTGGSATRDKITEIAIIIHDGLAEVESYSTLINPEVKIPYYITKLTGISNEMVENAPKFWEVAKKIIELTEGKIFVAHNVSFDYNFVRNEFKSLGYDYTRDKLCTVRLSRTLIPGKPSYSLGKLCESLGIPLQDRHRAMGDTAATAKLFSLLLSIKNSHPTFKKFGTEEIAKTRTDSLRENLVAKLPEETGVYYFLNSSNEIIYIGKSNNIRQRVFSHLTNNKTKRSIELINTIYDVDFVLTGSELIALLHESNEIKAHKPRFNRAKRRTLFEYAIYDSVDMAGYLNYTIGKVNEEQEPIACFASHYSAEEKLHELVEKHQLCQKLSSLYPTDSTCFGYQLKKCKGACIQQEDVNEYNERAQKIIDDLSLMNQNFIIIDKGKNIHEQSIVAVKNGKYLGYGYIPSNEQINEPNEFLNFIQKQHSNRDTISLIKSFVLAKKYVKRIEI